MSGVKTLQTVDRALRVLDAVGEQQPIGTAGLARALAMDKSAVQRILVSLEHAGWICPAGGSAAGWVLTTKPLHLARRATGAQLAARARPVLERLLEATGETVLLGVLEGTSLVTLEGMESRHAVRMSVRPGLVMPPDSSASGKAVLAALDASARETLLGRPPSADLVKELDTVARRGYATNIGEVDAGANSVAAAVLGTDRRPVGALVVAAPAFRLRQRQMARVGAMVSGAAADLAQRAG